MWSVSPQLSRELRKHDNARRLELLRRTTTTRLLLAFAISTSLLWVALIPLWDGFDEAQHFSYVQSLQIDRAWPVLGQTLITPEVWASFIGSPVSPGVKMNYPMLRAFGEAPTNTRRSMDHSLAIGNYEAHQAPMVYLALAPVEGALSRAGMPIAWRLRLLPVLPPRVLNGPVLAYRGGEPLPPRGIFRDFDYGDVSCKLWPCR